MLLPQRQMGLSFTGLFSFRNDGNLDDILHRRLALRRVPSGSASPSNGFLSHWSIDLVLFLSSSLFSKFDFIFDGWFFVPLVHRSDSIFGFDLIYRFFWIQYLRWLVLTTSSSSSSLSLRSGLNFGFLS